MNWNIWILASTLVLGVWAQDCPYGYSGQNCEDECGIVNVKPNVKIVNGVEAVAHSWPSLVYIEMNYDYDYKFPGEVFKKHNYGSACGGTLIDRYTILSAAHCFPNKITVQDVYGKDHTIPVRPNKYHKTFASIFNMYVGMHNVGPINNGGKLDRKKLFSDKVILHWGYNDESIKHDIAIVKLKEPVELNENIQLACLPNPTWNRFPNKVNISAYAAGWGDLKFNGNSPDKLHNVKFLIQPNKFCADLGDNAKNWDRQLCAGDLKGGKDTCQGDSGGPLFVVNKVNDKEKYVLAGVVSYGDGCGKYPGIYTRVSGYHNWINRYLGATK